VVAIPWARVEIEGKERGTTPMDRPLSLPVGKYTVRLVNPYFKTEERKVEIIKGKTVDLTVALKRRPREEEAKPDEARPLDEEAGSSETGPQDEEAE